MLFTDEQRWCNIMQVPSVNESATSTNDAEKNHASAWCLMSTPIGDTCKVGMAPAGLALKRLAKRKGDGEVFPFYYNIQYDAMEFGACRASQGITGTISILTSPAFDTLWKHEWASIQNYIGTSYEVFVQSIRHSIIHSTIVVQTLFRQSIHHTEKLLAPSHHSSAGIGFFNGQVFFSILYIMKSNDILAFGIRYRCKLSAMHFHFLIGHSHS